MRLPHCNPKSFYLYNAILTLGCCLLFTIAIELAIVWNRIGGLDNVGAVGQLVPAVIGIGGLVKVMWTLWRDRKIDKREEEAVPYGLRRCAELYEELRQLETRTD